LGEWLIRVGIIIAIAIVVFFVLFCCVVPFIRSMLAAAAAKQMLNISIKPTGVDIGYAHGYRVGPGLDELDDFDLEETIV
jgi:flagellar biosynthesis/type III secretory pathway M-ring protein FliF/YscJ